MNMAKHNFKRLIAIVMAFAMTVALIGCNKDVPKETKPTDPAEVNYTVTVTNKAGTPIDRCSVEIYTDATKSVQIYKGITNAEGLIRFTAPASDTYVATVSKLPTGYAPDESYPIKGEGTTIVVTPGVLTDKDMDTLSFSIGDAMMDFSIALPNGESVVLSELLQEKKAVVLNFWYLTCSPCMMEFPYIQEGFEQLSDDIAVLALNAVDGTDEQVAKFQSDNGYTFMMAKCDARWKYMWTADRSPVPAPTTIIIDRYGNVCQIHSGMLESTNQFVDMVNPYIQDDYQQNF